MYMRMIHTYTDTQDNAWKYRAIKNNKKTRLYQNNIFRGIQARRKEIKGKISTN